MTCIHGENKLYNLCVGFSGPMCKDDIDECLTADVYCVNSAGCSNSNGTYTCTCINATVSTIYGDLVTYVYEL